MALVLLCLPAMAEQRTVSDAQNVAMNYLRANAPRRVQGVNPQVKQLSLAMTAVNAEQQVDYYVFNSGKDDGFVIVSGDDMAAPVLGYSDEGTFDADRIPDGLRYWLECYGEQMQYLRSHPASAYVPRRAESTLVVTPLLATNWNQNSPYNDQCPTFGTAGERAAVGCVATATAQVMNYHKWPKQGAGEFTYVCNVGGMGEQTLSADFGSTTYDWDNMLDNYIAGNYSATEGNAVATLMSHVGIASHMKYGNTSSIATFAAMEALRLYFGYNSGMKLYSRISMNTQQWDSLLMSELQNARPVIYAGYSPKGGGHCFVLDGVNVDGYYHFNWGWGGSSNGYFLITALNPKDQGIGSYEGGYNASQEFIANVYPDRGEPLPEKFLEGTCFRFWSGVDHVNLGEKVPVHYRYLKFNSYGYGLSADITIGFLLSDAAGNQVSFTANNTKTFNWDFGVNYSLINDKSFTYNTPASLADGDYYLWLVYKWANPAATDYSYLANISNLPRFIKVKVQNGVMYFSTPVTELGELSVTDLAAPEVVGTNNKMDVSFTISNAGKEYYDNVYLALINKAGDYKIYDPININVPKDGTVSFTSVITAPSDPGEYELALLNKNYDKLAGGSLTVIVRESSNYNLTIATPLKVASYYMDMDNVSATVALNNNGTGDYVGAIPFMILSSDSKWIRFKGYTDAVVVPAGETVTVNIKTNFEGTPGLEYKMCLRDVKSPDKYVIWGDKVSFELNSYWPTTLLTKLLNEGVDNGEYRLADNLTVVDSHDQSLFATNGRGSWIEVKCGDFYDQVKDMKAFKAGTVWGKYHQTDGNPSVTLTKLPEAGLVQSVAAEKVDLSQALNVVADKVIDFTGYYMEVNGKPVIAAYDGSGGDAGQVVPISFEWLSEIDPVAEGVRYDLHGVIMLTPAASGAPARRADANSQNYTVYLTKAMAAVSTAVTRVNSDAVKINVTAGTIAVEGAKRVSVYSMTGALMGTGCNVRVPAGIYVVIADGVMRKVAVR